MKQIYFIKQTHLLSACIINIQIRTVAVGAGSVYVGMVQGCGKAMIII